MVVGSGTSLSVQVEIIYIKDNGNFGKKLGRCALISEKFKKVTIFFKKILLIY